jgi:hypothetical protein
MRLRPAVAAALCLTAATLTGGCSVDDITGAGYDFADVLPEMVDDFGGDARVISVLDRDGDVSFVVLGKDGRIHERDYELVCTNTGSNHGTSCKKRTTNRTRAPIRGERDTARVKLVDLDKDVVDDLRDKTDAFGGAPVGLRGNRWVVAAGAFEGWVADLDGSNVHRAESAADRQFANSVSPGAGARNPNDKTGSATGPPPDLPAPPGQLAQGRPDFAAFAAAIQAMRGKVGRNGKILFANVDDGIVVFEYIARNRYVYRVKWDPMERKLVDAGHPFGNGTEPEFPLSKLNARRIEQIAREAATKEHVEKTPGVAISVSGGAVTASMIVHTPTGGKTYSAEL